MPSLKLDAAMVGPQKITKNSSLRSSSWTRTRFFSVGLFAMTLLRLRQERAFVATLKEQNEINKVTAETMVAYDGEPIQKNEGMKKVGGDDTEKGVILQEQIDDIDYNEFNYTAYWEDALKKALDSAQREVMHPPTPCPKVYIYDLPSKLKDSSEKEKGFGKKVILKGSDKEFQGYLYNTNQYAFPSILEEWLKKSKLCQAKDPNEADQFFAPVLTAPKGGDEWKASCSMISGEEIRDALPYLNATNACRHFIAFGKGHYVGEFCPGWFSDPIDELKPFLRLAYSHISFDKYLNGTHSYTQNDNIQSSYPNLFSVPYPSSLHFYESKRDLPQFANAAERKLLMGFIGKDDHGDTLVRKQIATMCKLYRDK